jgi:hypothetical protein
MEPVIENENIDAGKRAQELGVAAVAARADALTVDFASDPAKVQQWNSFVEDVAYHRSSCAGHQRARQSKQTQIDVAACECLANRSRIYPEHGYAVTLRCGRDLLWRLFEGGPSPALCWWPSR